MSLLFSHSFRPSALRLLADTVNDASSTRKLYLLALGLALLGGLLLGVTVWFWRSTRPEPELLAPLEKMGTRRFRQLDGRTQKELLDAVRPEDAQPMRWGVVHGDPIPDAEIDLEAAARAEMIGYDDLREPEAESEVADGCDAVTPEIADVAGDVAATDVAATDVAAKAAEVAAVDAVHEDIVEAPADAATDDDEKPSSPASDQPRHDPRGGVLMDPLLRIPQSDAN